MFRSLICILQEKPQAGMSGAIGSLAAGSTPAILHIPKDEVIFWFQIVAFFVTILAGVLTAYAQSQKIKKNRRAPHEGS